MQLPIRRRQAETVARTIEAAPPMSRVAVLGADLPGLRPALAVSEGKTVRAGEVLFTDRRHPEIAIVAPVSGTVESIQLGRRRSLSTLVIRRDETPPVDSAPGAVRETLLSRGLWPAFLTRPFGRIPAPGARPEALFVNAVRGNTTAPEPQLVIEDRAEDFRRGLEALTELGEGQVYLCQAPGPDLARPEGRIEVAHFTSGLVSGHVHRLHPVRQGHEVWTIGYQDVIAIGHLMRTGRYLAERVVTLDLPQGRRLVRTVAGASLRELTAGTGGLERQARVMSGPAEGGREAAYLGRYHLEVTVGAEPREEPSRLAAIIPLAGLERALPIRTLAVPLMRALSVGDAETAERLGCLELVEEDMVQLSRICTSGADYGRLLRQVLDELSAA
jgi:Na+-transporting NADH:ubiquinone oxidoreductase subunit A